MSTEANYSLTVKVNGDLFTIRGDNAEQFADNLKNVITHDLLNFVGAVQETVLADKVPTGLQVIEQAFPNAKPVENFPHPNDSFPETPKPVAVSTFSGAQTVPMCDHGARKWNEGISKAGNPYKGWFCTHTVREQQCKPFYPPKGN